LSHHSLSSRRGGPLSKPPPKEGRAGFASLVPGNTPFITKKMRRHGGGEESCLFLEAGEYSRFRFEKGKKTRQEKGEVRRPRLSPSYRGKKRTISPEEERIRSKNSLYQSLPLPTPSSREKRERIRGKKGPTPFRLVRGSSL